MLQAKRVKVIAAAFSAFVAFFAIALCLIINSTPDEVVSGTAGNYTINIANGGYLVEDEGFLFFSKPNEKGIWRTETDKNNGAKKISNKGDGFLQNLKNTYYYNDDNKLISCDWDAKNQKTILNYAKKPLAVGSLIFYIDKNNNLCKYSTLTNKNATILKDKEVKEFLVYYRRIYYVDGKGDICKVGFDGNNNEVFIKAKNAASRLSIDGQYIFYLDGESLYSVMLSGKQLIKANIVKTSEYAIFGEYLVYKNENGIYHCNINKLIKKEKGYKAKELAKGEFNAISIDDDYFYYFDNNDNLFRIKHNGKNIQTVK